MVDHLADLNDLGVTVIELLPLNACDGRWNWGYDGAALFAPWQVYGTPDELRALIDRAHALGLAVILDVVYNHFGPAGNYTGQFSDQYVRPDVLTAWGPAINLGGPGSEHVRAFFVANARHWVEEYHFDGFRVDATHAFVDDGPRPFLAEFARAVRAATDRQLVLIAEDHRNLNTIIQPGDRRRLGLRRRLGRRLPPRHAPLPDRRPRRGLPGLRGDGRRSWPRRSTGAGSRRANTRTTAGSTGGPTRPASRPSGSSSACRTTTGSATAAGATDCTTRSTRRPIAPRPPPCSWPPRRRCCCRGRSGPPRPRSSTSPTTPPNSARRSATGRAREFQLYDDFNTPAKLAAIPDPQAESTFRAAASTGPSATASRTPRSSGGIRPCCTFAAMRPLGAGDPAISAIGPDGIDFSSAREPASWRSSTCGVPRLPARRRAFGPRRRSS